MKHLVFIVNPRSGTDRQKKIEQAISSRLDTAQFSWEIQNTRYAQHGTELAAEAAAKGAYAVVAVGGDGSVNDIVKGLTGTDTALAIIPKGSGNGMARSLQIPLKEEKAIDLINRGKTIQMDIAFANEHLFISNAGVAFDALISRKFSGSKNRGLLVYSWLVIRYLWTYREWEWDIVVDGMPLREKAFIISIANGQQFGYNFTIAPGASWTDGLLDVVIVRKFPKIYSAIFSWRLLFRTILKSNFVQHYRAKEIVITHPALRLMQTDGDAHPCPPEIHFRVAPGMQKVLVL